MRSTALCAFALMLCCAGPGAAGEYNTVLSIGDKAPAWVSLPNVNGKAHSLEDLRDKKLVVVAFTCNSCPYAVDYEDRMIELARKLEQVGDAAVVAINVNRVPEDLPPAMKERAEEKGFNFPYLFDESQEIARKYGATRTPEFFLLDRNRKVVYMGAMDDSSDASKVQTKYLEEAITAVRAGKPVEPAETPPVGCAVRFVRSRRR